MNVKALVTFGLGVLDSFKTKNWQSNKSNSQDGTMDKGALLGNDGGTHHAKHDIDNAPDEKKS